MAKTGAPRPARARRRDRHKSGVQPGARPRAGELTHAGGGGNSEAQNGEGGAEEGSWEALGIGPALSAHVRASGFVTPTSVQAAAIPPAVAGRDVMVRASTGSGKTLCFLLPIADDLGGREPRVKREGEGDGGVG